MLQKNWTKLLLLLVLQHMVSLTDIEDSNVLGTISEKLKFIEVFKDYSSMAPTIIISHYSNRWNINLSNLGTATAGAFQAAITTLIAAKAATECIQTESKESNWSVCNKVESFGRRKRRRRKRKKENWNLKRYTPSIEASFLLAARLDVIIVWHLLLCWWLCSSHYILGGVKGDSYI